MSEQIANLVPSRRTPSRRAGADYIARRTTLAVKNSPQLEDLTEEQADSVFNIATLNRLVEDAERRTNALSVDWEAQREAFLGDCQSPHTRRAYAHALDILSEWLSKMDLAPSDLDPANADEFIRDLLRERRVYAGVARPLDADTVRLVVNICSSFYGHLERSCGKKIGLTNPFRGTRARPKSTWATATIPSTGDVEVLREAMDPVTRAAMEVVIDRTPHRWSARPGDRRGRALLHLHEGEALQRARSDRGARAAGNQGGGAGSAKAILPGDVPRGQEQATRGGDGRQHHRRAQDAAAPDVREAAGGRRTLDGLLMARLPPRLRAGERRQGSPVAQGSARAFEHQHHGEIPREHAPRGNGTDVTANGDFEAWLLDDLERQVGEDKRKKRQRELEYIESHPEVLKRILLDRYLRQCRAIRQRASAERDEASRCIRGLVAGMLRSAGARKTLRSSRYVGCSPDFLRRHIEAQFKPGMSWANRGEWHVDHIVPLSWFEFERTPRLVYVASHWKNLRPAWASENLSKGNGTRGTGRM